MKKRFDPRDCELKTVWCGDTPRPLNKTNNTGIKIKYTRDGSRGECLKKGIGAGLSQERSKTLSKLSLQQIPYIGETFEKKINEYGIYNLTNLQTFLKRQNDTQVENFIIDVTTDKKGRINSNAFNSLVWYIYQNKYVSDDFLPSCK